MFFWTLQSKSVLKEAEEKDIYYPNFELSPQSHINDYNRVLNAFNQLNHSNYKGLIFCLAPEQNSERINEYKNVEIIKQLFQNNTEIKNLYFFLIKNKKTSICFIKTNNVYLT